jgi:hypothetical protein
MTAAERKQAIADFIKITEPAMTGIKIMYHGERKTFDAYLIPLDLLVYNPYNGRIGSVVKSYERQNHKINNENPEDVLLIEQFLWESKIEANKKTMQSLLDDHQEKYGIITAEGVIIDGNRRASLLNRIRKDTNIDPMKKQHCEYFLAIVLPIDADKKEILRLETTYQMGEDAKVDYNPIEKYLKCQDLRDAGFTTQEISRFMGDSESNVKMYLAVLQLMNEYLENYGYTGMYTVLPSTNEDSFQKLHGALKGYRAGNVSCMWDFDPEVDTTDLKLIAFDYIRAGFDQTKFRDIIRKPTSTTPAASFFGCKDIWESFKERHFSQIDPVTDAEESVESILQNANPEDDVARLLRKRDNAWKTKVHASIEENFGKSNEKLRNKQEADNPLKLLQKVLDTLSDIDTSQQSFQEDPQVLECVREIGRKVWEYKKMLEK